MKRHTLILLAAMLLFQTAGFAATPDKDGGLTVISFNIRYGDAKDGTNSWSMRCPATYYMLEDQKPDVIGMQEALTYQIAFIEENLTNYKGIGVGRIDGKHEGEHAAIFYNKKTVSLKKWGTFWLSETPDKPSMGWDAACSRTATWALMKDKKTGKQFYFVNTHLDHVGKEAQMKGLALIVEKIAQINSKGLPMILTGDFNVKPDDAVLTDLDSKMTSARKGAAESDNYGSFNGWGRKSEIIDYIYYSGFSSCREFMTIKKKYADKPFISDHFPIKAVLIF
ncbi:MAG: endonuclease/exonuclease/phosphatase family protein [Candidatus Cryptobacteroides sp.]